LNYLEGAEKFYDLFGAKNDVNFYIEEAERYGGPILELGVGTARLAIKIAEVGFETWRIDNSNYMLNTARSKKASLHKEVKEKLNLVLSDARDFSIDKRFGMIYFPSGSFDHILKRENQIRTLQVIREHLKPGGVFIFNLYLVQYSDLDQRWFVQRRPLDDEHMVVRTGFSKIMLDRNLISMDIWYELFKGGRMIERYHEGSEVYLHTREDIHVLLEETDYSILTEYGNYERDPYREGDEMIIIIAEPKK
jgi:SAM-dependent methyltransferase